MTKSVAIARNNRLFAITPGGATASTRIFSLIETAKANGQHPYKYLSVLLIEFPNASNDSDIKVLLPGSLTLQQVDGMFDQYPSPNVKRNLLNQLVQLFVLHASHTLAIVLIPDQ